jgi:hypothetical protein
VNLGLIDAVPGIVIVDLRSLDKIIVQFQRYYRTGGIRFGFVTNDGRSRKRPLGRASGEEPGKALPVRRIVSVDTHLVLSSRPWLGHTIQKKNTRQAARVMSPDRFILHIGDCRRLFRADAVTIGAIGRRYRFKE